MVQLLICNHACVDVSTRGNWELDRVENVMISVAIDTMSEDFVAWAIMQNVRPKAGNRAGKSSRRYQWLEHMGELGVGSGNEQC